MHKLLEELLESYKHVPITKTIFKVIFYKESIPIKELSVNRNEVSTIVDSPNAEYISAQQNTIPKPTIKNISYDAKLRFKNSLPALL